MPRLKPLHLGLIQWLSLVTVLAASLALSLEAIPYPQPELMRSIAEIGVTILLAYVVEAVWMTTRLDRESENKRESWLGASAGFGLAGLIGVVAALLVAEHLAAGHANFLDRFGLWWSAISLGWLGIAVALYPVIVDRWSQKAD